MSHFSGKVAVITGAGSGIGRALAQALNKAGCELELSDINSAALEETRAHLPRQELGCHLQQLDERIAAVWNNGPGTSRRATVRWIS